MTNHLERLKQHPSFAIAAMLFAFVLLRLIAVVLTPLNLGPDEAQYWRWSETVDWGYYSKPPMIAWMISFTTSIFGNSEWAIRLYAPIGHAIAAYCIFLLGKQAFSFKVGAWACFTYMLMPGVWLSSAVISTDGLLLPFWTLSLLFLFKLRTHKNYFYAIGLGVAVGCAFLSKYAALYFLIGLALSALIDAKTRKALISPYGLAGLAAFALTILPNLLWNAANDFATVGHTADNANLENSTYNPMNLIKFLSDQMGVFGPITFLLLAGGATLVLPKIISQNNSNERWLLCFILPPLIAIATIAFASRAHANWAASAYPAASVLLAAMVARANWWNILKFGLGINLVTGLLFIILTVNQSLANDLGLSNAFKRARGWEASVIEIDKAAKKIGANGIVFDERENWHGMDYYQYLLKAPAKHYLWQRLNAPHAFAESFAPVPEGVDDVFLVAALRPSFVPRMREDFETLEHIGRIDIDLEGGKYRSFCIYKATNFKLVDRDSDYEQRLETVEEPCPTPRKNAIPYR